MREIGLTDWRSFVDSVQIMIPSAANENAFMFRGQAVAEWTLSCSLHRALQQPSHDKAVAAEQYALHHFKSNALRFSRNEDLPPHIPLQPIMEWWSLMQHHGVPTRLLDLTASPYVAAYFACETNWEDDGAIYFMYRGQIEQVADSCLPKPGNHEYEKAIQSSDSQHAIRTYFPEKMTDRFAAQQGMFIYSDNVISNLQSDLDGLYLSFTKENPRLPSFGKFIIGKELKRDFMMKLRTLNVTAQTLFPGVDGLGRYVAEGIRIGLNT